jgi:hypothetical protein
VLQARDEYLKESRALRTQHGLSPVRVFGGRGRGSRAFQVRHEYRAPLPCECLRGNTGVSGTTRVSVPPSVRVPAGEHGRFISYGRQSGCRARMRRCRMRPHHRK